MTDLALNGAYSGKREYLETWMSVTPCYLINDILDFSKIEG